MLTFSLEMQTIKQHYVFIWLIFRPTSVNHKVQWGSRSVAGFQKGWGSCSMQGMGRGEGKVMLHQQKYLASQPNSGRTSIMCTRLLLS